MENKNINEKEIKNTQKEQLITLSNRQNLSISGVSKIISLKPDLIQLDTNFGGLMINGEKLELVKLDNSTNHAEITGKVSSFKYIEDRSKEPLFRKIFK